MKDQERIDHVSSVAARRPADRRGRCAMQPERYQRSVDVAKAVLERDARRVLPIPQLYEVRVKQPVPSERVVVDQGRGGLTDAVGEGTIEHVLRERLGLDDGRARESPGQMALRHVPI